MKNLPPLGDHLIAALSSLGLFDQLSQHDRLLQLETAALPAGALVPETAKVTEAINTPFCIDLDVITPSGALPVEQLLGEQITLRLLQADGSRRPWHGYIFAVSHLGSDGGHARKHLQIKPWFSFLDLRRDCFIFQDKTALEIAEEIFQDYPQANWRMAVPEPLRQRSICTQYRETDLEFVARLLAEEGLSFHFEHLDGEASDDAASAGKAQHRLVITDRSAPHQHAGEFRFAQTRDSADRSDLNRVDTITHWRIGSRAGTNAATVGSWDYKRLRGLQGRDQSHLRPENLPRLEHYDGSGAYRYESDEHAQRAATLVLQRAEQHYLQAQAEGSARRLAPALDFDLVEHASHNGRYTVRSVVHEMANNLGAHAAKLVGRVELEKGSYLNRIEAQLAAVPVLPEFVRKPTVDGCQTALVVGLPGEALTVDRDGRVKVQFHWQRGEAPNPGGLSHTPDSAKPDGNAPGDDRSGTWLRVARPAAGANWGLVFNPRLGTEVLIDYLDGDIDRPLVVGQLFNGQDTPPFAAGVDSGANHPGVIDGVHSPTLNRDGYNEWAIDNATRQLRMRLLCSYTVAEVGLGHLIQQSPASGQRGTARGVGFEIGTQGWCSLRGAKGLLLSTNLRPGTYGSVQSTQMDAAEAVSLLKGAQNLAERLNDAAKVMKAQTLSAHRDGGSVPRLIASLDPRQDGKYDGPVNGQEAVKPDGSPVERPATPTIVLDSASSIAAVSESGLASFAGEDQAWVSQGDWHESAGHTFSLVSGKTASWYAHNGGIQLKAANGPVSLRAHSDELQILADQDVQILSVNDEITITAKTRIELLGGDSKIVLDGANIDFVTPGAFTVKAATHSWAAASKGEPVDLPTLPVQLVNGEYGIRYRFVDQSTGVAFGKHRYRVKARSGTVLQGITDEEGWAQLMVTSDADIASAWVAEFPVEMESISRSALI